ncbi:MAG: hypothetical protein ACOX4R_06195 [Lentihominibacter sp.]|jgi:hypothetical protein
MNNNIPIVAEFYPTIPRAELEVNSKHIINLKEMSELGKTFLGVATAISSAMIEAPEATEGLYRCIFPEGINGKLATFKDGSGFLGTILNEKGLAAQARWIPAEGASATMMIDPVTIAIAVALAGINKKLADIKEYQVKILQFLHDDKESELEAMVNTLAEMFNNYKHQSENERWKTGHLTSLTRFKIEAEKNIIFYRRQIQRTIEKQKLLYISKETNSAKEELYKYFKYYRMAAYINAFAAFMEIILSANTGQIYLEEITSKLRENAIQYREDYTKAYGVIEKMTAKALDAKALGGIASVSKAVGDKIAKVPLLKKSPADEALIAAGEKLDEFGVKQADALLEEFTENRASGLELFIENIEHINEISNKPVELLFDKERLYICA